MLAGLYVTGQSHRIPTLQIQHTYIAIALPEEVVKSAVDGRLFLHGQDTARSNNITLMHEHELVWIATLVPRGIVTWKLAVGWRAGAVSMPGSTSANNTVVTYSSNIFIHDLQLRELGIAQRCPCLVRHNVATWHRSSETQSHEIWLSITLAIRVVGPEGQSSAAMVARKRHGTTMDSLSCCDSAQGEQLHT